MLNHFLIYLAEASMVMLVFALSYQLLFRKLSYFQWNRAYLMGSLLLSILIPLLPLHFLFSSQTVLAQRGLFNFNNLGISAATAVVPSLSNVQETDASLFFRAFAWAALIIYLLGVLYKAFRLQQHVTALYQLIRSNQQHPKDNYTLIYTQHKAAPFSFLHYIFLPAQNDLLTEKEQAQVLQHEQIHVTQKHSLDLIFFELSSIFFWFNPAIYYLGRQIREAHEFQADGLITQARGSKKQYGQLLLKLAGQRSASPLMHTFFSKQLVHRISMLTQPKSSPMLKVKYLGVLPVVALTLFLSSFSESKVQTADPATDNAKTQTETVADQAIIGNITWTGNKVYTDAALSQALGLRRGDPYSEAAINNRLNYHPDGSDVSSLYMDNGYMFFSITPKTVFTGNMVDVEFLVEEGPQMKLGQIIIKGNTQVSTAEILEKMGMKSEELFSRAKIIKAQQALIAMDLFNQETIGINPIPHPEMGTTDLEFVLEER